MPYPDEVGRFPIETESSCAKLMCNTAFGHSAATDTPPRQRIDRSRERYPLDGSLEERYVEEPMAQQNHYPQKMDLPFQHDEIMRRSYRPRHSEEPRRTKVNFDDRGMSIQAAMMSSLMCIGYDVSDESDSDYKRSRAVRRRVQFDDRGTSMLYGDVGVFSNML